MKLKILMFLFFSQVFISAQNNTTDFFSLKIGNYWDYRTQYMSKKISVVSDSLFSNGKIYSVLSEEDFVGGQYLRTDSLYVYYYDIINNVEVPFFKLKGNVGNTTEVGFKGFSRVQITSIDSTEMFNEKIHIIKYLLESLTITEITLSNKFGPISASFYEDPPPPWPIYTYNLIGCIINGIYHGDIVSVRDKNTIPNKIALFQNYPNPFNPNTVISYFIPSVETGYIPSLLKVYDVLGREVATLVDEEQKSGYYSVKFDASSLSSGIYFYTITVGSFHQTKKMVLLR